MSQTVTVSLERKGKVFDLDTQCMALGKIHVDPDLLPENERSGTAKRMLGASILYCFIGSFADALQARGATFEKITGEAVVTAGDDGTGRRRILGVGLKVSVFMDEASIGVYEHVAKIMRKGCLVSASVEKAFPVTYDLTLVTAPSAGA